MLWTSGIWGQMPVDKSRISKKKLARIENQHELINWIEDGVTTALNMYEWSGLPESCDERMIERSALLYGHYMIAKVGGGYISPACVPSSGYNLYGYPLTAWGWGLNGYNHLFNVYVPGSEDSREVAKGIQGVASKSPEAVIGRDNSDAYPYINYIITNASRMADTLRAADVAIQNLKSPGIIFCDDTQLNTIKSILEQRSDNVATIIAIKGSVTQEDLKYFPTQMHHEVVKEFWEYFSNVRALNSELFGQNSNENGDKRERLLVDEINANNEQTYESADKRLRWRQKFCADVKQVFGLDISVKLRKEGYPDDRSDDIGGVAGGTPGGGDLAGGYGSGDPDGDR